MQINRKDDRISVLRCLACLFIINSHCGDLYPVSLLAVGGAQGNIIFFVISGYCLANIALPFGVWIKKRVMKILPSTIFFLVVRILLVDGIRMLKNMSVEIVVMRYVDLYWFVFAILIYYVIFYIALKRRNKIFIAVLLGVYVCAYIVCYIFLLDISEFSVELEGFSPFKVLFYFGPFYTGGVIRLLLERRLKALDTNCRGLCALGMILGLAVWAVEYSCILLLGEWYGFQFLIHVGIFVFGISTLLFILSIPKDKLKISGRFGDCVRLIGDSTLAVYLIQVTLKPLCLNFEFPVNAFLFWFVALAGGCFYNVMNKKLIMHRRGNAI